MKNYAPILFFIILFGCNENESINGIETTGQYSLIKNKNVTYTLPQTFRYNMPFSKVFYDKKTQKEYITFGNDYATDSLYIFDLLKGGNPIQTTKLPINSKGVFCISLDSIIVITKKNPSLYLLNNFGEILYSNHFSSNIDIKNIDFGGNNSFYYNQNNQDIFLRANIEDWDYEEKNRFANIKKYKSAILNKFNYLKLTNVFSDSIKYKTLYSSFYKRFINEHQTFFSLPKFYITDSIIYCTSAYSDSLYCLNHLEETPKIKAIPISSSFFDTINCTPDPLIKEEDAYTMEFLSSRIINNALAKIYFLKSKKLFLINISSKATKLNESGNGEEFDDYRGLIILDEKLKKKGEFRFKKKYCSFVSDSLILLRVIPDKTSPTYNPKKLNYEIYTLVDNN